MKRILVVDDERQITRMLRASLQGSGYEVLTAANGSEAYARFETDPPDLIITDLAMPEMSGLDLTRAVRRIAQTPIIVLSVRDTDIMKVMALDEGADDYLTKPFSMPELLARVRAQLRRTAEMEPEMHLEVGDFVVDIDAHTVSVHGNAVHLTPKEFDLLTLCCVIRSRDDAQGATALHMGAGRGRPAWNICACWSRSCAKRLNAEMALTTSRVSHGSAIAAALWRHRRISSTLRNLRLLNGFSTDSLCPQALK